MSYLRRSVQVIALLLAAGASVTASSQRPASGIKRPPVIALVMVQRAAQDANVASFAGAVRDAVELALRKNPNVVYSTEDRRTYVVRDDDQAELRAPIDAGVETDYWVGASVLGRADEAASGTGGGLETFDAVLCVARSSASRMPKTFRFESSEAEAAMLVEIGVDALLGRILEPDLGVLRIRANERPSRVRLVRGLGGPSESAQDAGIFTTYNLRGRPGVEMVSDPLLTGGYRIVAAFAGLPDMEERVAVGSREDTIVLFDTGRGEERATGGVPHVAVLALVGFEPSQVVYMSREGDGPRAGAYLSRSAEGSAVVEWTEAVEREQWSVGRDGDAVVLEQLPTGRYSVRTWLGESVGVGKVALLGTGPETSVELGREPATMSLSGLGVMGGSGRLNLFWTPFGPPAGARVYIDDAFVGMAFDAGLVSVLGLTPGPHAVRLVGEGFKDVDRAIDVAADRETSVFLRLRAGVETADAGLGSGAVGSE